MSSSYSLLSTKINTRVAKCYISEHNFVVHVSMRYGFTNKIPIQRSAFNDLVHVSMLFRSFFNCLKSGKFIFFIKRLIEINLQKKKYLQA